VPWDEAIDEYENLDDVGYQRKDVAGQQQFEELELELQEGRDSEHFFTHQQGASTVGADTDDAFEDAQDDEDTSSSSSVDLSPHHSMARSSHATSEVGRSGGKSRPADETWDMGPMDIKFAEPVTTPRKSSPGKQQEESKPVLSRVESLSSSFKDFDIERDEQYSGRVSGVLSDTDMQADPEVIDFPPIPLAEITPQDLEAFSLQPVLNPHPAPSTSAPSAPSAPSDSGGQGITLEPRPMSAEGRSKSSGPDEPRTVQKGPEAVKEVAAGGFSFFPVTPPSADPPQPDSKLFKSWPSVRSSCTSEVIGPSDDDNTAADYADDEYSKSVSKPTSRSPSQNLSEVLHKQMMGGMSGDEEPGDHGATSGWSFDVAPRQNKTDPGGKAVSREPSLDLVPSQPPQSGTSSISEPSNKPGPSTNATDKQQASASTAAKAEEGSKEQVAEGSSKADGKAADPTKESAGGPAAKKAGDAASPSADAESPGPAMTKAKEASLGGAASLGELPEHVHPPVPEPELGSSPTTTSKADQDTTGVVADVVAHMIQLSLESLPMSSTSQHGDEDEVASSRGSHAAEGHEADAESSDEDHDDVESAAAIRLAAADDAVAAAEALNWQELQIHASPSAQPPEAPSPRYTVDENGVLTYEYDTEYIAQKYEVFDLRIYHRRQRTGFEETKDFPIRMNDLIAGRYQVMDFLGSAAFSRAVQALDTKTGMLVCLKIIKNNKDYFDQSLDEIKLLKFVNTYDPEDKHGLVRLYDYFYFKEHLFLVCELLRANLYEFQKYNRESGDAPYFTNARIQRIAKQVLGSLAYLHSLGLIHSDLKPENILIKSYSRCEVKVIDLGSSCFTSDQLSSYVQSRSYRAPEVILGLPYDQKIDVWSLGCILAELSSGFVLFQNDSLSTLLARLEGILGPMPEWMVRKGRYSHRFYTRSGHLYERNPTTERYELLVPKRTCLRHRVPDADDGLLGFISHLLHTDPHKRPTAAEALQHPWLHKEYPSMDA